jgi:hypothetical protein
MRLHQSCCRAVRTCGVMPPSFAPWIADSRSFGPIYANGAASPAASRWHERSLPNGRRYFPHCLGGGIGFAFFARPICWRRPEAMVSLSGISTPTPARLAGSVTTCAWWDGHAACDTRLGQRARRGGIARLPCPLTCRPRANSKREPPQDTVVVTPWPTTVVFGVSAEQARQMRSAPGQR